MIIPGIQLYETTTNPCYRHNQQITDLPHLHYLGENQFHGLWVRRNEFRGCKMYSKAVCRCSNLLSATKND